MSHPVLVDTDVISYIFKGHSLALGYATLLRDHVAMCSFMTLAELHRWALGNRWGSRRVSDLIEEIGHYTILLPNQEICRSWATVTLEGQRKGRPISPQDAWNAAIARHFSIPLITHNASDYDMLDDLKILTLPV